MTLCEIDANWSNGGISCEHCDAWYHGDCARLKLSSFNRLESPVFFSLFIIIVMNRARFGFGFDLDLLQVYF